MTDFIYKLDISKSKSGDCFHSLNSHILTEPILLPVHTTVQEKLDIFLKNNKVPHIIFHGNSGVGKRTIVYDFLNKIYNYDKHKLKTNVKIGRAHV